MKRYNLRAYALIIHEGSILVTDEFRIGTRMTKFPGGGHEWGESLIETIARECMEELGQTPVTIEHFYTTDIFVVSAFREDDQMISVYYKVEIPFPEKVEVKQKAFDFAEEVDGAQIFRWIPLGDFSSVDVTYPIDKKVAGLLTK